MQKFYDGPNEKKISKCSKCGNNGKVITISTTWIPRGGMYVYTDRTTGVLKYDLLQRKCGRCGYWWEEWPTDHTKEDEDYKEDIDYGNK